MRLYVIEEKPRPTRQTGGPAHGVLDQCSRAYQLVARPKIVRTPRTYSRDYIQGHEVLDLGTCSGVKLTFALGPSPMQRFDHMKLNLPLTSDKVRPELDTNGTTAPLDLCD